MVLLFYTISEVYTIFGMVSTMIVSSGYRKNGFDAHGGKLLQKKDIVFTRLHKKNRKFRIDSNLTKICGYSYYFVKNILFISLSS